MSQKKIKLKKPTFVLSPLALLTLAACGGGGGGGQSGGGGGSFSVGGHIVKGPLTNALVGLDYDGDGIVDSSTVRTGSDGSFTISTSNSNYTIIAVTDETTIDTSSGSVLAGATLKAPAGATVVTPTTTLMEEAGLNAAQVAAVLDLPDGVDPLSFNPYAAGVDPDKALAVEQAGQQVMSAVTAFAAAAEGAGASKADAFEAALTAVADVVSDKATKVNDPNASAADKSLDLTSSADLALIKDKVVAEVSTTSGVNTTAFNALADDAATAVKNVNDEIATVTDLTSDAAKNVFSTVQVLTDQVKTATAAEVNTAGSGSISFTDASVVNAAARNKPPTDITLTSSSISEGALSLVVGTLKTTDSDQSDGVAFIYEIAEISGTDYGAFSINQSTGELSLRDQPDYESKTSYSINIVSTDEGGKTYSKSFSISVTDTNEAPTVANAISDQTIAEDSALSFQFASDVFIDVDARDSLTYTAALSTDAALPSWLSFDASTITFSGTPANADVGSIDIKVTATDGSATSVSDTFALAVTNTNDAPTVANAISDQTIAEDSALNFQFNSNVFSDIDAGDSFTYSATISDGSTLPSWLSFNAASRTFSGTPLNGDVGAIDVKVTATDSGSAAITDSFKITVSNTADAPTGISFSSNSVAENSMGAVVGDIIVEDNDNDVTSYTLASGGDNEYFEFYRSQLKLKNGVTFDYETKQSYEIEVTATDLTGLSVTEKEIVTVSQSNEAPSASDTRISVSDGVAKSFSSSDFSYSDPEGKSINKIKVLSVSESAGGSLKLNGDLVASGDEILASDFSNLVYQPLAGEVGDNYFRLAYQVHDGTSYSNVAGVLSVDVVPTAILANNANAITANVETSGQSYQLLTKSTGDNSLDHLMTGGKWADNAGNSDGIYLTYSFFNSNSNFEYLSLSEKSKLSEPTNAAKTAAREAFDEIASFTNLKFIEVVDNGTNSGDLRINIDNGAILGPNTLGGAFLPGTQGLYSYGALDGDIFLANNAANANPSSGSDGYYTIIHEIGHALGLAHPFHAGEINPNYTFGADTNQGENVHDSSIYSVMSYGMSLDGTSTQYRPDPTSGSYMADDIAALQYLYGVNNSHASGDNVYDYNYFTANGNGFIKSFYDAGGTDTFDFTDQNFDVSGSFGKNQFLFLDGNRGNAVYGDGTISSTTDRDIFRLEQNEGVLSVAKVNMEGYLGSRGVEDVTGSDASNFIFGGFGYQSQDILAGGSGADTFLLTGTNFTISASECDIISDFDASSDVIGLELGLIYTDLSFEQSSSGCYIKDGNNNYLLKLQNVSKNDLDASNFITTTYLDDALAVLKNSGPSLDH